MKHPPRFIHRTITDGKIKFNHRYWKPDLPLPDRFEGMRCVFGTYISSGYVVYELALWGSDHDYWTDDGRDWKNNFFCNDKFEFIWYIWKPMEKYNETFIE